MGWWKAQGTKDIIGDIPLDALGDAVRVVVAEYQSSFNRKPTKAEWEALLRVVLGNEMPEFRCMDDGVAERVSIDLK